MFDIIQQNWLILQKIAFLMMIHYLFFNFKGSFSHVHGITILCFEADGISKLNYFSHNSIISIYLMDNDAEVIKNAL